MNIEVNWHSEAQDCLLVTFQPGWTWDDLFRALLQQEHFFRSVNGPVHVIMDCRNAAPLPDDAGRYRHTLVGPLNDVRGSLTVLVGAGATVRAILESVTYMRAFRSGKRTVIVARSIEEAHGLLGARARAAS